MHQRTVAAVVGLLLAIPVAWSQAQPPPTAPAARAPVARAPVAVTATIVAINGNVVTIANARGEKRTLELASSKGLVAGAKVGWCEEDCRVLQTAVNSIPVMRVLSTTR